MAKLNVDSDNLYRDLPKELTDLKNNFAVFRAEFNPKRNKYDKAARYITEDKQVKYASSTNIDHWTDFDTAIKWLALYDMDGIALRLEPPFVLFDVDGINEEIDKFKKGQDGLVSQIIDLTDSYVETSLSGKGIHAIFKAYPNTTKTRRNNFEMYTRDRYVCLTGKVISPDNTVRAIDPDNLKYLEKTYIDINDYQKQKDTNKAIQGTELNVHEIIEKIERSRNADKFKRLMSGNTQGYESQSDADMALASILAFWCGRDIDKMREIFEMSELSKREKWNAKRGNSTYGLNTLQHAIDTTAEVYEQGTQDDIPLYTLVSDEKKLIDKVKKMPSYSWDDTGFGERFVYLFGDKVKYISGIGRFRIWDNKKWELDSKDNTEVLKMLDIFNKVIKTEKIYLPEDMEEEQATKEWQKTLKRYRGVKGKGELIKEIKHRIDSRREDFDRNPYLINTRKHIIDVTNPKEFRVLKHEPHYQLTKMLDVDFDPEATYPAWDKFVEEIALGDKELIEFLQVTSGYCLLGEKNEHKLIYALGKGANGKSVFYNAIADVFGTYGQRMQAQTIMVNKSGSSGARPELARMESARFIFSSEPNEGDRMDEGLVKQLTGGDTLATRGMYQNTFEFKPTFQMVIAANHMPLKRGRDFGINRRLVVIPFKNNIPLDKIDKTLPAKFATDEAKTYIFNWLLQGLEKYLLTQKFPYCKAVEEETNNYIKEQDYMAQFIEDCCEVDIDYFVKSSTLYDAYKQWASDTNNYLPNRQVFSKELMRNFTKTRRGDGYYFVGLTLNKEIDEEIYYKNMYRKKYYK